MTLSQCIRLFVIGLLTFAVPAYANNPPQPDGLFSMLLIIPFAIVGMRVARVPPERRSLLSRIVRAIILLGLLLVLGAGDEIGPLAAVAVLIYAIMRASQMIRLGQGTKRIVFGSVVILFSLFAVVDYVVSCATNVSSLALHESITVGNLRSITSAQLEFAKSIKAGGHDAETFATLDELENAGSLPSRFSGGRIVSGYQYVEFLDADKKRFIVYAIPAPGMSPSQNVHLVPGSSLFGAIFHGKGREEGTGERSFVVDETGVIRFAIRPNPIPPARDEYAAWKPLQ